LPSPPLRSSLRYSLGAIVLGRFRRRQRRLLHIRLRTHTLLYINFHVTIYRSIIYLRSTSHLCELPSHSRRTAVVREVCLRRVVPVRSSMCPSLHLSAPSTQKKLPIGINKTTRSVCGCLMGKWYIYLLVLISLLVGT